MKKLLLFPCLLLALGLSSCESSDDEVMSIELVLSLIHISEPTRH